MLGILNIIFENDNANIQCDFNSIDSSSVIQNLALFKFTDPSQ